MSPKRLSGTSPTTYRITIRNPGHGVCEPGPIHTMLLDGVMQTDHASHLVDDSHVHIIEIEIEIE